MASPDETVGQPIDQGVTYMYCTGENMLEGRRKTSSVAKDDAESPVAWANSKKASRRVENFPCPRPTRWDLRMFLKEKGEDMMKWGRKPFRDLKLRVRN